MKFRETISGIFLDNAVHESHDMTLWNFIMIIKTISGLGGEL